MQLLISLAPALLQFALWLLEVFFKGKAMDAESRKLFLQLAQKLRENGVKNARSIFEAEEAQVQDGEAYWNAKEKEKEQ